MTPIQDYQLATGLSIGHTHQKLCYNGQDAMAIYRSPELVVGIVADGCGAGAHSEVGARLGVVYLLELCKRHFRRQKFDAVFLLQQTIEYLHSLCDLHAPTDRRAFVEEHLLFTLLGFVATPTDTHIFHAGDGYVLLNDKMYTIDHDNRPPYIGGHLLGHHSTFVTEHRPTQELERLLIGTDGLRDLPIPVPSLLDEDEFFHSEVALPRYLHEQSTAGQLKDDVAVVMWRRGE